MTDFPQSPPDPTEEDESTNYALPPDTPENATAITSQPVEPQEPRRVPVYLPDVKPYVTYGIIAVTVLVYLAQYATQTLIGLDIPYQFGVKYNPLIDAGEYWRLLTPMLLHGGLMHIGFNMYALYILGPWLERFYGHWQFLLLYTLGGLTGNIVSYLRIPNPSLGASTATFGLLAAYGILAYRNQKTFGARGKAMVQNALQVIIINLFIGLTPGIDNWGHLGGALGGIALAWLAGPIVDLDKKDPNRYTMKNTRSDSQFLMTFVLLFLFAFAIGIILPGAS